MAQTTYVSGFSFLSSKQTVTIVMIAAPQAYKLSSTIFTEI